eukprot:TRINITY_DN33763_c0_g1_i1.p1 TRINITY_DN33763_c0_g1~~TRINITY_DN33763_c0_g1_i1.p1  ORF type:complete len:290 (-),score=69.66 TRINITY_DN33763_c0_g1_i1:31-900(-)
MDPVPINVPLKLGPARLNLDHISEATRLLEKRREMFEVQAALEAQKDEFDQSEENVKKREEALHKRNADLQESLIKFDKFLKENDAKKARADKKSQDEIRARLQKETEVSELRLLYEQSLNRKAKLVSILDKYMLYQEYLENVVETGDDYPEIRHLMERHATLEAANSQLQKQARASTESIEALRRELEGYVQERTNQALANNNTIAESRRSLDGLRTLVAEREATAEADMNALSSQTAALGQIRMAVDNLYHRVLGHTGGQVLAHSAEPQILVVNDFLLDLQDIADGK